MIQCPPSILRCYGNSKDGDAFFNSIRTLFLSFNTLMDRPLDEGVKIKVSTVIVKDALRAVPKTSEYIAG